MGPYSHIVIANELIQFIKPENEDDYYWGAVAPDVRYLVQNMPRKHTHFSAEKILNLMIKYPEQKDFLQGYLVHCVTDKIEIRRILQKRFPFSLLKKRITKNNSSLILEFFNVEILKPVRKIIMGKSNPILTEIGIGNKEILKFSQEIDNYIKNLSSKSSFLLYQNLGFAQDRKLEKYKKLQNKWQESWFKNNFKLLGPLIRRVNWEIASLVREQIPKT